MEIASPPRSCSALLVPAARPARQNKRLGRLCVPLGGAVLGEQLINNFNKLYFFVREASLLHRAVQLQRKLTRTEISRLYFEIK